VRRAANRDKGEPAIVDALRSCGASVRFWGINGAPDLVVGFQGRTYLLECKAPLGRKGGDKDKSQALNAIQTEWHRTWRGHVAVVRSPFGALVAIGAVKAEGGA
jgi:hypothetical protein